MSTYYAVSSVAFFSGKITQIILVFLRCRLAAKAQPVEHVIQQRFAQVSSI